MAPSSRPDMQSDRIQDYVAWIDQALDKDRPTLEVASVLAEYALPNHRGLVSPLVYGFEGWFWPWNRVGFAYIQKERYLDAASIFSGAYLAALRIQHDYQERLHKAMPLCNIAYSLLRVGETIRAALPSALGVIEDILSFGDPRSAANLSNLRASGYREWLVQMIIGYTNDAYRSKGRLPLYPEIVLRTMRWEPFLYLETTIAVNIQQLVADLQRTASRFAPDRVESSLKYLELVWQQYSLGDPSVYPQGDLLHGRAESALEIGPGPISGLAPTSGSNAGR
jgi:hypothetical protein